MNTGERGKKTVSDRETEPKTGLSDYPPIPPFSSGGDQPLDEALSILREAIHYSTARLRSHKVDVKEKMHWAGILAYQIAVLTKLVKGTPEEKEVREDLVTIISKFPLKYRRIVYPVEKTPTKTVKVVPGDTGKDF